ncbi:perlucin-like protein [Mytilus edulis]|uniref:perlucin-like protein n=1 Tax=Mytilus edulis TaxID=6550 RepID=UPI0039EE2219
MILVPIILFMFLYKNVVSLPCLSNESKEDFDDSRIALKDMENNLKNTVGNLESSFNKITALIEKELVVIKTALKTVGEKIKKVDSDFQVLGKDFQKTKWHKYNGHCYYYSSDLQDWFTAERKCREIGGYLMKIDDKQENAKIHASRPKDEEYWIGLTDVVEGEYRWTFDQTKATFLTWHKGYGKRGKGYECCGLHAGSKPEWFDFSCNQKFNYLCESNFCF